MTNDDTDPQDLATLLAEPPRRPWYRRRWPWALLAALVLAALAVPAWLAQREEASRPVFVSQPAARGRITLSVVANGTLQPTRTVNIGSELSGTVSRVLVDVNDRVKKGQVLVELDTAKLQDQVNRSRAAVASADAKVAQSTATVTEATASLARLDEVARLSGGKVPSKAELDTARATLARAEADAAASRASVADAKAQLSTDQTSLGKASIRAPSDGVVLTRSVDPGNAVAASLQAVTLLTIAEDLSKLKLQVNVDEADVGAVKAAQDATFTVSAYPTRRFPARITRVAYGSTITDNVVTYLAYLDVDNADLSLRPGMTATATIAAVQRDDALLVPNAALRFAPAEKADDGAAAGDNRGIVGSLIPRPPGMGGPRRQAGAQAPAAAASGAKPGRVFTLRDGRPVPLAVTTGISDGRFTEVTGGELQPGMPVVTDQKAAASK